jgi:predicted ArsR family transcriptional regulator
MNAWQVHEAARKARIIEALQGCPQTAREVADAMDIPRSTAREYLRDLDAAGQVVQTEQVRPPAGGKRAPQYAAQEAEA